MKSLIAIAITIQWLPSNLEGKKGVMSSVRFARHTRNHKYRGTSQITPHRMNNYYRFAHLYVVQEN